MKRRKLLLAGAAFCAGGGLARLAWAQAANYASPQRLSRPNMATDEGGLWSMMDREEKALRRSPFALKDEKLKSWVQDMACRLGGEHCPDIRIHLVRTPVFNASMAPNGMMQVWTGLLLRVENEAQLAAILGHEIGHYLQRHSVEQLRDIKSRSAFGQFIGLFGLVGAVGQMAVLASAFAYGREHEREADRIGAYLMHKAGYDVAEASRVWGNLLEELRAREGKEPEQVSPLFTTHPAPPERREVLSQYAQAMPGGIKGEENFVIQTGRFLDGWLQDEVKRGQYAESLALMGRLLARKDAAGLVYFYRGEVYRLRGESGDLDLALEDYRASSLSPNSPPAAFRGIGLICRQRGEKTEARAALDRYLELAPDAPDSAFIKNYLSELSS